MTRMKNPITSIIIPSYNCAPWLERAVESAYALGSQAVEVIVIDDGSTDETPALCANLKQQYPDLKVIRQTNGGLSAARNTGLDAATGEFVFLLDADDEAIVFNLELLKIFQGDILRMGVEEVLVDGSCRLRQQEHASASGAAFLQNGLMPGNWDFYIPSWAYIYRRSFIDSNHLRFPVGLIHEDMLFTIQALLAAQTVAATKTLAYRYIRRPGSITQQVTYASRRRRVMSVMRIVDALILLTNEHPEVDLWLWTSEVIDYGWNSGQVGDSRKLAWALFLAECRLFMQYRLWGRYRKRSDTKWRLRVALTRFLFLRNPHNMGSNRSDSGPNMGRLNG